MTIGTALGTQVVVGAPTTSSPITNLKDAEQIIIAEMLAVHKSSKRAADAYSQVVGGKLWQAAGYSSLEEWEDELEYKLERAGVPGLALSTWRQWRSGVLLHLALDLDPALLGAANGTRLGATRQAAQALKARAGRIPADVPEEKRQRIRHLLVASSQEANERKPLEERQASADLAQEAARGAGVMIKPHWKAGASGWVYINLEVTGTKPYWYEITLVDPPPEVLEYLAERLTLPVLT